MCEYTHGTPEECIHGCILQLRVEKIAEAGFEKETRGFLEISDKDN